MFNCFQSVEIKESGGRFSDNFYQCIRKYTGTWPSLKILETECIIILHVRSNQAITFIGFHFTTVTVGDRLNFLIGQ